MKLNIFNVQDMQVREQSSGDSFWRKITITTGSLVKPEKFEINLFWVKPPFIMQTDDDTVVIKPEIKQITQ